MKSKVWIFLVVLLICVNFSACNNAQDEGAIIVPDSFEIDFTADYVVQRISLIPTIKEIDIEVAGENEQGVDSRDGCKILIYFSSSMVDQDEFKEDKPRDKGTSCGGSIEIYTTNEAAKERDEYLSNAILSLMSPGEHKVISNVVVRISKKMTSTQQDELEDLIYAVLTTEKEAALDNIVSYDFTGYEEEEEDYEYSVKVTYIENNQKDEIKETESEVVIEVAEDEVLMPFAAKSYKGRNYLEILNELKTLGFNNVSTEIIKDVMLGIIVADGNVESVTIGGVEDFDRNHIFKKDDEIIIKYHVYTDEVIKEQEHEKDVLDNKNNEESLTIDNCSELEEILSENYSEEKNIAFLEIYEGRIIEIDAKMTWSTAMEIGGGGDTWAYFYAIIDGKQADRPCFLERNVNLNRYGFEKFERPGHFSEKYNVHVKFRIKGFDKDKRYFNIDVIEVRELQ